MRDFFLLLLKINFSHINSQFCFLRYLLVRFTQRIIIIINSHSDLIQNKLNRTSGNMKYKTLLEKKKHLIDDI